MQIIRPTRDRRRTQRRAHGRRPPRRGLGGRRRGGGDVLRRAPASRRTAHLGDGAGFRRRVRVGPSMRITILIAITCCGCEAIDDFNRFHVAAADDGAPQDAGRFDLAVMALDSAPLADFSALDLESPCVPSLANVGQGDFSIRFRITTAASVLSTVLFQRAECDALKDFWEVDLLATGQLQIAVGEGNQGYATLTTTTTVNDGKPHFLVIERRAKQLSVLVDGTTEGGSVVAAPAALHDLPPLGIANSNPCSSAGVHTLNGTVSDVCLSAP